MRITKVWKTYFKDADGLHQVRLSSSGRVIVRVVKLTLNNVDKSHGRPPTPLEVVLIVKHGFGLTH